MTIMRMMHTMTWMDCACVAFLKETKRQLLYHLYEFEDWNESDIGMIFQDQYIQYNKIQYKLVNFVTVYHFKMIVMFL